MPQPFDSAALETNRAGRLTPDQAAAFRAEAAETRGSGIKAGLVLSVLGGVVIFGVVSGRIPNAGPQPILVGVAMAAFGLLTILFGGIRASRKTADAAAAGTVRSVEGPLRRRQVDRVEQRRLMGEPTGNISAANRYEPYLDIAGESYPVTPAQYAAAPDDAIVRLYLLGSTDEVVNLERVGDQAHDVPAPVRAILERAGVLAEAEPASPATPGSPSGSAATLDGDDLARAITGRWRSEAMGIDLEFQADGTIVSHGRNAGAERRRWSVSGPDRVTVDGSEMAVRITADGLAMGEPGGPLLQFRHVA